MQLGKGRDACRIPILYEDRSVMAIDKPAGWLLVPFSWDRTPRNLTAAMAAAIAAGSYWARSRNLRCLRPVHRLDGETSGVLLLSKSPGGVRSYGELFESREMSKRYLAVVHGRPKEESWVCRESIARDEKQPGRMRLDAGKGKASETAFRWLASEGDQSLIEARPVTGRTHQIRLHLRHAGLPIVGDALYGPDASGYRVPLRYRAAYPMGLRAVTLSYADPFLRKQVRIEAPVDGFLRAHGFEGKDRPAGTGPVI